MKKHFLLPPLNQPSTSFSSHPRIFPHVREESEQSFLIYHFYDIPSISIGTFNYLISVLKTIIPASCFSDRSSSILHPYCPSLNLFMYAVSLMRWDVPEMHTTLKNCKWHKNAPCCVLCSSLDFLTFDLLLHQYQRWCTMSLRNEIWGSYIQFHRDRSYYSKHGPDSLRCNCQQINSPKSAEPLMLF